MSALGTRCAPSLEGQAIEPAQGRRRACVRLLLGVLLLMWPCTGRCGFTTLTLAWNPVPDPQVVGYKLHYGTLSRSYNHVLSVGAEARGAIPGLSPGTTYFFAVTSVTLSGTESDYSDEISYTVASPPGTSAGGGPVQYCGLFYESDQVRQGRAGEVVLSATRGARYSGYLQMGSARLPFHGQFDAQGQATNWLARQGLGGLRLQFHLTGDEQLQGTIAGDTWVADLSADHPLLNSKSNPSPFQGAYTLVIPGSDQNGPALPFGHSFGLVHIDAAGRVRLALSLADGTKQSLSAWLSPQARWPLYAPLYAGQGLLLSWLSFTNRLTDDFHGALSWLKPANRLARYYPAGFTNAVQALGSDFSPASGLSRQSSTDVVLSFMGGNLAADFAKSLPVKSSGYVSFISSNWLSVAFSASSGAFRGLVKDPSSGKLLPFAGALFQKVHTGYGFLLDGDRSSRVLLPMARALVPPTILSLTGAGSPNVVLTWSAVCNVVYRVQYKAELNSQQWSDLVPDVTAAGVSASTMDPSAQGTQRFYRVMALP
jgi:hypothetical protein